MVLTGHPPEDFRAPAGDGDKDSRREISGGVDGVTEVDTERHPESSKHGAERYGDEAVRWVHVFRVEDRENTHQQQSRADYLKHGTHRNQSDVFNMLCFPW